MSTEQLTTGKLTGPSVNRHRSEQVVSTPWEFIRAVEKKFGPIAVDLAATAENAKARKFISPAVDTFTQNWADWLNGGLGWLNPEFDPMKRWVHKCWLEQQRGAEFLALAPASIGANWFEDSVWPFATVYALKPRIVFEGSTTPYPKDLILSHYQQRITKRLEIWRWR